MFCYIAVIGYIFSAKNTNYLHPIRDWHTLHNSSDLQHSEDLFNVHR